MCLCRKPVKQSFISTIDEIHFIRFKIVQKVPLNKPGSIEWTITTNLVSFSGLQQLIMPDIHDGLQIKAYICCSSRLEIAIKWAG